MHTRCWWLWHGCKHLRDISSDVRENQRHTLNHSRHNVIARLADSYLQFRTQVHRLPWDDSCLLVGIPVFRQGYSLAGAIVAEDVAAATAMMLQYKASRITTAADQCAAHLAEEHGELSFAAMACSGHGIVGPDISVFPGLHGALVSAQSRKQVFAQATFRLF